MKLKKFLVSTLSVAALSTALATGASALTMGSIPGGGANTNQGVDPVYGTSSRLGWYGANLWLGGGGGTATITVEYLGSEAGNDNKFFFGGVERFATGGDTDEWVGDVGFVGGSDSILNVADGLLNFKFTTSTGGEAVNGANPDDATGMVPVNFFATLVTPSGNPQGYSGTVWDLWFDDGGASNDDNHDDMAIRISVTGGTISQVPVPAAGLLLLTALGGLGVARRRRKAA